MNLRKKIAAVASAAVIAVSLAIVPVMSANAYAPRLDNWSGQTVYMRNNNIYEWVGNGAAGHNITAWRVPANSCVRITYRDGFARNYTAGSSPFWIATRSVTMDAYLSRC